MKVHKDGMELKYRHDCAKDLAEYEKEKVDMVCIWIGTIWGEDLDDGVPFPQLMILRKSIGMGGVAATPGAYERVEILSVNPNVNDKSQVDIIMAWFREARVTEVMIV